MVYEQEGLDSNSLILDIGGYLGDYSAEMFARYGCRIKVFEPMPSFAEKAKQRFIKNDKIEVYSFGLGEETKTEEISVDDDASSFHQNKKNKKKISVSIVDVVEWFNENPIDSIPFVSMNIEGGEYPLLERLIESGYINKFENIQIQFHDIYQKDAEIRMTKIQQELSKTHELVFQYKFVWEKWKKKKNI